MRRTTYGFSIGEEDLYDIPSAWLVSRLFVRELLLLRERSVAGTFCAAARVTYEPPSYDRMHRVRVTFDASAWTGRPR